jgi:hypothetical protein
LDARRVSGTDLSVAMVPVDANEYFETRLEAEIAWYDKKSARNKTCNTVCKIAEIACAAIIPLLAGYAKDGYSCISISIGGLGAAVAICAGISAVLKFQEQWIKYRTTAESLKKGEVPFSD